MTTSNGSLLLFRLFGIKVFVHWSWLIVAAISIRLRADVYGSPIWNALEYFSLFGIVLMHEFGHALACRSVGGKAETIMLWPLGGIAFVSPPMRPGAVLWSIFAGPLVNIVLLPVTVIGAYYAIQMRPDTDLAWFAYEIARINVALLIFNMIPVYPLDGGQILHSLLWFPLGYVRSLQIASIIGLAGTIGLALLFYSLGMGTFSFVILAFIGLQAWNGFRTAQFLARNPQAAMRVEHGQGGEQVLLEENPQQVQQHGHLPPPPPPFDRR